MKMPCRYCENKGCGAYHDQCEKYQIYKKELSDKKEKIWINLGKPKHKYVVSKNSPLKRKKVK